MFIPSRPRNALTEPECPFYKFLSTTKMHAQTSPSTTKTGVAPRYDVQGYVTFDATKTTQTNQASAARPAARVEATKAVGDSETWFWCTNGCPAGSSYA
ncbi:Aste57867_6599 [Aphanomyces stellatus]|uniref:Aste57867_2652 protein n=1 Tax=Aphanomyces stellatus TaxID=120398 RepID=A0A485KEX0_9STRA|nr:hypothetical protein As57867_006582 [Aphanomyces stellatus]KAF0716813.1 hypothetical protein As57867_002645 [Aphanomyces stellatus]VFT79846.1 Aste57867_2652 [Aphanomyces stellatus]VFT83578.1 Aste57867_6599 [Aphanomyces stellatus]